MECQILGCHKQAIIDDDDSDDALCLCESHQGVELVHYVEQPEPLTDCQCPGCITKRQRAIKAYKAGISL
jgi:hypothetical protein